ncbi:leucine permease transcriptional regulator protein [Stemphylium lycopersici]|nr:leucine permease transcriptional regulator protein [Stemphylium lycopersici]
MVTPRGGRGGGGDRGRGARGNYTPHANRGRGRSNAQSDDERATPAQALYTRGQGRQHSNSNSTSGRGGGARGNFSNSNPFTSHKSPPAPTFAPHEYQKRLQYIKSERPKIREHFVQHGLMNPEGQMRLSDSVKLYGICDQMCPEYERVRRIVELDVKAPECTPETQHLPSRNQRVPDESRMVKAYARSAAGMDVELVSEIRSPATCLNTLKYLFGRLDQDDFQFLHSWLWDRTRAVRKDLRTQRIENKENIGILLTSLEHSARFYMLSAHHMARSTKDDYSHQQDVEQLNQTLISLKERYVDNRRAGIISANEAEFWAYRLILAPIYANTQLENELHRLPSDLRNNPRVKTALEIFRVLKAIIIHRGYDNFVQCQSNWKVFWDIIKSQRVSYLMACAAAICFNRVRHVVLDSVWRAYRVGQYRHQVTVEGWTTDKLREALGFDTDSEAMQFCEAHGFVFEVNHEGQTFLDIKQKSYERKAAVLSKADVKPQFFSASIVEAKRHGRPLSVVIAGLTVQESKKGGLLFHNTSVQQTTQADDQTSLFIPEKPNIFSQQINGKKPSSGRFDFNPTASPFKSNDTPAGSPNPFIKAPQPGVFDPTKNPVKFAPSADAPSNPFLQQKNTTLFQSTTPAPPANPFLKSNSSTQSQPAAPASSGNPFMPGAFTTTTQPTAQTQIPASNPQSSAPTEIPAPAPVFDFSASGPNSTPSLETPQTSFSFTPAGTPPQDDASAQEVEAQKAEQEQREAAEKQQREDEARRRVQEAQRAKQAKEEEQRREAAAAAERQRREQADRERKAHEEQEELARQVRQRQAQEEEARAARAREMDSALYALTADIMFNPEEGLLMQFIENAAMNISKEAAKAVEMERRVAHVDRKYEKYLLELKRAGLAKIMAAVQKKKRMQKAKERRKRLKERRAQTNSKDNELIEGSVPLQPATLNGNATLNAQPDCRSISHRRPSNTRRAKRTEERRNIPAPETNGTTKLSAESTKSALKAIDKAHATLNPSTRDDNASVLAYSQTYRQAASTAPVDRTETDWFRLRAMGIDPSKHRKRSFDFTSSDEEKPIQIESKRPKISSTSPVAEHHLPLTPKTMEEEQRDRAEAIKHSFKRSISATSPSQSINGTVPFNSRSSYNDSSSSLIERARKSVAGAKAEMPPPLCTNGSMSHYRAGPFDGNASQLVARAKGVVPPHDTTPKVQHDWSRSVPNLGFSASQSRQSMYSNSSFGTTMATKHRPAYWGRASRFVPRHLYGQGAEAVRAYRVEQGLSKSPSSTRPNSTEPLNFSSPVSTQKTYLQHSDRTQTQGYVQEPYSETEEASGVDVVDVDAEDSNAAMSDTEDFVGGREPQQQRFGATDSYPKTQFLTADEDEDADSEMLDDEDEEEDDHELLDYDEDEEEELEDEDILESFEEEGDDEESGGEAEGGEINMKPGATEDDAIELSD